MWLYSYFLGVGIASVWNGDRGVYFVWTMWVVKRLFEEINTIRKNILLHNVVQESFHTRRKG